MWERKHRFKKDISERDGTIGKVFKYHRDELMESKSIDELRAKVAEVLENAGVDTPKSRLVKFKLETMTLDKGLMYIQNILFAAMGMQTF